MASVPYFLGFGILLSVDSSLTIRLTARILFLAASK